MNILKRFHCRLVDAELENENNPYVPSVVPSLLACLLASIWIGMGTIHRDQHGDSILNVLISLQKWTPFVWEQDRFGMLVPLLAIPIRHPLVNLIFQAIVSIFAGLASFFLLARFAFRDATYPAVGLLGAASFLVLTPAYYRFEYLVDTSYGLGFTLALWSLMLVEPGRGRAGLMAALVLMALAHWVNSATALFLVPLLLLKGLIGLAPASSWIGTFPDQGCSIQDRLESYWRWAWSAEWFRGLLLLFVGHWIGQFLIMINPDQPTNFGAITMAEWPETWILLLQTSWKGLEPPYWMLAMILETVLGVVFLIWPGRVSQGRTWATVASLVATAGALWVLLGTRHWIKINAYAFRYLFPSALMLQTATAGLAVRCRLFSMLRGRRSLRPRGSFAMVVLLWCGAFSYGIPSLPGVRRDIDRVCGSLTDDLMASRSTCLAGDYWKVWPAVFHVNLVRHERGDPQPFWGWTFRASPTFREWRREPRERCVAAVVNGDTLGEVWLNCLPLGPWKLTEVRPTIRVYRFGK